MTNKDINNYNIGLGTYKLNDKLCTDIINNGLQIGYRLIDTAIMYNNHKDIATGIFLSKINRNDIFIISKIDNKNIRKVNIAEATDNIIKELELTSSYIDLILLHYPVKNYDKAWKDLIYCKEHYNIKNIGTSNFEMEHLDTIIKQTNIKPYINQIQLNIFNQNKYLIEYHNINNIITHAHTTLTKSNLLYNDLITNYSYNKNIDNDVFMYKFVLDQNIGILCKTTNIKHLNKNYLLKNMNKIFYDNDYLEYLSIDIQYKVF